MHSHVARGVEYSATPRITASAPWIWYAKSRSESVVGYPIDFGADRSEIKDPASNEYQVVWTSLTRSGGGPIVIFKTKWIVERDSKTEIVPNV